VYRQGNLTDMPLFGESGEVPAPRHIEKAVRLMLLTSLLAALAFIGVRWMVW
jgi:adenosylcobinamide-phosphate synthase